MRLLPTTTTLREVCQLCFEEIPASEHHKHLLEYHKIAIKVINNPKPLRRWFDRVTDRTVKDYTEST
jgi:hypothetical protein